MACDYMTSGGAAMKSFLLRSTFVLIGIIALSGLVAYAEETAGVAPSNYFAEGIKYRGEGNCEKAIESYQLARREKQFKEDWAYYLAVADCYAALKKFDEAIHAYTRVIESTKNRSLQAEMFKGRGKTYYAKASKAGNRGDTFIELARKDLREAKALGADVADIEKNIAADIERKPAEVKTDDLSKAVTDQAVVLVEGSDKIITGDGEYALHLSNETVIKDRDGKIIAAGDIRPGDVIDFSYSTSYLNRADGMIHAAATIITVHRSVPARMKTVEKRKSGFTYEDSLAFERIHQKLEQIDKELKEIKAKQAAPKKEVKPAKKTKAKKKATKQAAAESVKEKTAASTKAP